MNTRAVLYMRVSSAEQSFANQRPRLVALAEERGLTIVGEYAEIGSVARKRPEFDRMMADARRRRFDVLLVTAIDRLGRSLLGNLKAFVELEEHGVQVLSAREAFTAEKGPTRDLMLSILSWVAEQERAIIRERTKDGLERVRAKGVRLGAPVRKPLPMAEVMALRAQGVSYGKIAKRFNVSDVHVLTLVRRYEKELAKTGT